MSDADPTRERATDEAWRALLTGAHPVLGRYRLFRRIPSAPRCKFCAAPFAGIGAPLMRMVGRNRWHKNPRYCGFCFRALESRPGGAEVETSLLFADVRGSTTLGERLRPADFTRLMNRFYRIAADRLVEHDGIVDKFVGDEVVGIFIPAIAGAGHARRAIDAAFDLLTAMRREAPELAIGAGVNTGIAYVGSIGETAGVDFTALGDAVNVTARLASAAAAGELLVTDAAAGASRLDDADRERRPLQLRGRAEAVEAVVLRATDHRPSYRSEAALGA